MKSILRLNSTGHGDVTRSLKAIAGCLLCLVFLPTLLGAESLSSTAQKAGRGPVQAGMGGGDSDAGSLVIGAEVYAGYLAVSPKVDSLSKSVTRADSFDQINRYGYSFFVTTSPEPLTSFMFFAPIFSLSDYSATDKSRVLEANSGELGAGLYFNTGDLNRGRVGWYLGFLVHGTATKLKGDFQYGSDSWYTSYIYADTLAGGNSGYDHPDMLYLSRDHADTLEDDQETTYLLYKLGALSKDQYSMLDLYTYARPDDLPKLLLLQAAGVPVANIHKYYVFRNEENRKSGLFTGAGTAAEWGYQGDWFFFKHKLVFPYKMTSSKGKLYAESQTLSMGVFYQF